VVNFIAKNFEWKTLSYKMLQAVAELPEDADMLFLEYCWEDCDQATPHPGGNPGEDLQSIFHRCYLREVAFEWELSQKNIHLPLDCLQGGSTPYPFSGEQV
jgi:hypothetical protein